MKRFTAYLLAGAVSLPLAAQITDDGFYRVQNDETERYITMIENHGSINMRTNSADLKAIQTISPFEAVACNPASVIYFKNAGFATVTDYAYDLAAQGTSMVEIVGFHVQLHQVKRGIYQAYKSKDGVTVYLSDRSADWGDTAQVVTDYAKTRNWRVIPITADNNYLAVQPSLKVGSNYYQTLYASYGYQFLSSSTKAYTVTSIQQSDGVVIWKPLTGPVPPATPVIISSTSNQATRNKMTPLLTTSTTAGTNKLTGVYFCCSISGHINRVAFKSSTMRVLGKLSDGSIGFTNKVSLSYIPANTAYLTVPSGSPAELKLMTQAEYDAYKEEQALNTPVTITAKSYTREYGDANPTFDYTIGGTLLSGAPVLTCAATKDSPAGTYPIVVAAGTVKNGHPTLVNGTLTITKAPLTVRAADASKVEQDANPALTFSYSGFKNSDEASVLTRQPVVSTAATLDSRAGQYDITVSGGESDRYAFTYQKGTLTVSERPAITLTARSFTREYGEANPTLEYTLSGGDLLGGAPELSCAATKDSPAGEYPITIAVGTVKNYRYHLVAGTLTVTKAPLTVRAADAAKVEQDENPSLSLSYTGFKNSDDASVLSRQPIATTEATAESRAGEYPITVSGGASDRYAFTYQNGTLTVSERPAITLTARSFTREYGDENPTLDYTLTGGDLLGGAPVLTCEATKDSPAGEYPITIAAGTVKNYRYHLVAGTLTVTKAPLTVLAADAAKVEQDENPALSFSYAGFKNSDDASVLTRQPVVSTEATAESRAGEYPITVSGGASDRYAFTYQNGTLTVSERPVVTLTARSFTREYGDDNPAFTYTVEGTLLGGTPVLTCAATKDSPAGEYPITIAEGSVTNWHTALVGGTLTITKAPLTVKADDCVKVEQDENPALSFSYAGFKNSDDESILLRQPEVSTEATTESHAGEYAVTVSGGESDRYEFIYRDGILTVRQRDQIVITALSLTREYGDENPTLEYIVEGELLGGEPVVTCEAGPDSPAGEYAIDLAPGTVVNYNYVLRSGTLTVTKAPLTVGVVDAQRYQYDDDPVFQLTYSGFKNADDESVLQAVPLVESGATYYSEPGTYPLYVWGGESDRYAFTYTEGQLTVLIPAAVSGLRADGPSPFDVYTLSGAKVRSQVTTLSGLPRGIYLVGGRKVTVR